MSLPMPVRTTLQPDPADVEGFRTFLNQYKACLRVELRLPQKICKECTTDEKL